MNFRVRARRHLFHRALEPALVPLVDAGGPMVHDGARLEVDDRAAGTRGPGGPGSPDGASGDGTEGPGEKSDEGTVEGEFREV